MTEADWQELEEQRARDDADFEREIVRAEPHWFLQLFVYESKAVPGQWYLTVTRTTEAGERLECARVGLSLQQLTQAVVKELANA